MRTKPKDQSSPPEERSLERAGIAFEERQRAEEDDQELALQELIRSLHTPRVLARGGDWDEDGMRPFEMACRRCHLVVHRARIGDRAAGICIDCLN